MCKLAKSPEKIRADWCQRQMRGTKVEKKSLLRHALHLQAQNGATALHNAAGSGFETTVQALLAAHADIDVQNTNCNTALHLAAGKGIQPS